MQAIFYNDWDNAHIPEILEEIYIHEVYKPFLLGKKDLIIADVGGNICLTSGYFSKYAKQVYCVEPAKQHQEVIRKFIEFNGITNIKLCPYAISNKSGKVKFFHQTNTTAHSLGFAQDPKDYEEVETMTLGKFMEINKIDTIDLLKLDPEGEEGKIITSEHFAKYADRIKVIVGEWHAWGTMEQHQFANTLTDLGYKFHWIPGLKASVYTAVRI